MCGRSFNQEALSRHQRICEKVFMKKRKQFNTQAQRIAEPEQKQLMKQSVGKNAPKSKPAAGMDWK